MINRINRISIKSMTACAAILFLMSLLPLLLLGRYNVMCIDDYDYGMLVHDTWIATGSLYQCVLTAFEQVKIVFMNIQGAYTSCFLMSMCPMNFRYDSAFVVPVIMIGMFSVSSFLLGRQILTKWLGSDKYRASFVMFIMLFMFYQVIEAPFEGIYWYNGSVHYIFMESLLFIILTLVSSAIWGEKKAQAAVCCIAASIIAPVNAGCNLVTALQAEVLLLLLLIYVFIARRSKLIYALIPYLTYTAGFLCNVLAPGHRVRAQVDTAVGYSPIPAVLLSFYYSIVFMVQWTYVFVILVWLALLPVLWRIAKASDKDFKHPVWVTAGVYCIISAMFTPTLYGLGTVGLSRVDNIIQMVYYLSLIMLTVYWFGWISHHDSEGSGRDNAVSDIEQSDRHKTVSDIEQSGRHKTVSDIEQSDRHKTVSDVEQLGRHKTTSVGGQLGTFLESTQNMMTVSFLFLVMIVWVFTADKNTYTSISALRSLVIGDGRAYYTEAMQRHELYIDDTVRDVVVEPYSMKPALFDFDDLSEDQWYWLNTAVTTYYHKHSVRLMEKD